MKNKKLNTKFQTLKSNHAITLIALIITIVVMLILVAITLAIALGENGIISKSKEAKIKTEQAMIQEDIMNIALGHYDMLKGYYSFPELKNEILQKYPDVTFEYYFLDDELGVIPVTLSDEQFELYYQNIEEADRCKFSYTVLKDDMSIVIASDDIRVGNIEMDNIIYDGDSKYVFNYKSASVSISEYIGNETNIDIPAGVYQYNTDDKMILTVLEIEEDAFCDMAHFYTHKKAIDDLFDVTPVEQTLDKPREQITIGEFLAVLESTGQVFETDYYGSDMLIFTNNPDEKIIVNDLILEIYIKGELGLTEEYCDIDDDGDICVYEKDGAYISKQRTNKIAETITIPRSVNKIASNAFGYITTLKEVTFKHTTEDIQSATNRVSFSSYIFEGCENLEKIYFPNATIDSVKSNLHYYTNAWGANKDVQIICSDGTINVPET